MTLFKSLVTSSLLLGFAVSAQAARKPKTIPSPTPIASPTHIDSAFTPNQETPVSQPVELPDLTLDKDGGITLSLEDSIRLAIRGATSVLKAENDTKVNGALLLQGYGQFLPNFGGNGNYNYSRGTTYYTTAAPALVQGSGWNAGYTLASDLNIFNGLADISALKSALLRKDASDLTLYRAKQQIALDITQAFLQVILDNKLVDINRKNLQETQAREDLLTEQTKVGIRNLSELFRAQAATSAAESLLLTSQNTTRTDQILFLRRLRADVAKKYHFTEPDLTSESGASKKYTDENELLKTGLANRADLKAYDNIASATSWDVKSNFAGYLPKLDLVGSMVSGSHYLYDQNVNGQPVAPAVQSNLGYQLGTQIQYTIGLNLTWAIFDRFVTHENVVRSRAVADDAELDAQDRFNQVEGDVRQSFGSYQTAIGQLRSSKKGLDAAQKAYEVMEGRYEVGSASYLDLITVQADLVQAESNRATALIDYLYEDALVNFSTGQTKVE
jgi:outer membrane protein